MSRTITMSNTAGIKLTNPGDNPVTVAQGVTLGGTSTSNYGIYGTSLSSWSILNLGTVAGHVEGVTLAAGGTVTNGSVSDHSASMLSTYDGVAVHGAGVIGNFGTVVGSSNYISNDRYGSATIAIGNGVALGSGRVTNGAGSPHALISGGRYGVDIYSGSGSVTNDGTIVGLGYFQDNYYTNPNAATTGFLGAGIALERGGSVTNGGIGDTAATIKGGANGVLVTNHAGVVTNSGTINAVSSGFYYNFESSTYDTGTGVSLAAGGMVTNGASNVTTALIEGGKYGVVISGQTGKVSNFGIISAPGYVQDLGRMGHYGYSRDGTGIVLANGGTITNGASAFHTGALIKAGYIGVDVKGQFGLVSNYGNIEAITPSYQQYHRYFLGKGVVLQAGGHVINGSAAVHNALIEGGAVGVQVGGAFSTVGNDGTISASGSPHVGAGGYGAAGTGVLVTAGGKVNNGFYGVTSALISGKQVGVSVSGGPGTVVNSGTVVGGIGVAFGAGTNTATLTNTGVITGIGGTAVSFTTGNDTVAIGAGAVFNGNVVASTSGTNVLDLLSGPAAGSVSGLGSKFRNFGTVALQNAAGWSLTGSNAATGKLGIQLGTGSHLSVTGSLAVGASLALSGPGEVSVAKTGRVVVGHSGTGASGLITVDSASGSFAAGTIAGNGTIATGVTDNGSIIASRGTLALDGAVNGAGTIAISAHAVLDAVASLTTARLTFLAGGSGVLELGTPKSVTSLISGFIHGDRMDLLGKVATSETFSGASHILTVGGAGGVLAALHFAGNYTTASFHLASDGHGGTNITLS